MNFRNYKIGSKQMIGMSVILSIMAGVNIFSIIKLASLKQSIDEVSKNWLPRAIAISAINRTTSDLRINQLQHAFAKDETIKQIQANNMIELIDKINENLDTYEALKADSENRNLYSTKEREHYENFDQKWEEYQDLSFEFFKLSRDNKNQQAIDLLNGAAREVFNDFSASLESLVDINKIEAGEAAIRAEKTFSYTRNIITVLLIITLFISFTFATALIRYITVPIQNLEKAAKKVADGNLDVKLDVISNDEIGGLSRSFNQMTASLKLATEKMQKQSDDLEYKNKDLERTLLKLKSTQEQLMIQGKMAALGNLVAGIAHEINNPIGAINSASDVSKRCLKNIESALIQNDKTENNEQIAKSLKILKENIDVNITAGNRIATIVRSLKNFAHLDASEYKQVDIHEGIDSTLTLLENEFRGRIVVEKQYGDIQKILCYPGLLNQAYFNILKNASESIENAGKIIIKTFQNKNSIHIQISDNGKGIPAGKLNKIFDFVFSSAGSRIKMGSGLATVYNIINKHQGDVKIDSKADKGTTVCLILPIK